MLKKYIKIITQLMNKNRLIQRKFTKKTLWFLQNKGSAIFITKKNCNKKTIGESPKKIKVKI